MAARELRTGAALCHRGLWPWHFASIGAILGRVADQRLAMENGERCHEPGANVLPGAVRRGAGLRLTAAMVFVEAAGHRLEVDRIPGGTPTLVFLHEGLGCVARWRDFPRAVAASTKRAALVYSRRGYGQSEPSPRPWPVSFMHDEARRVLPALLEREGIGESVLIGHSDGASIALVYTGEIGRGVRGVVALAPHVFVEDVCVRAIGALRTQYLNPATKVRQKLGKHHADVDGAFHGWADAWLSPEFSAWDLTGFLPSVRAPVMVIQGEDDEYGTVAQVDAVCGGVAGPAEKVILPACGHVPQRDKREETLAAIVRFVCRS